MACDFFTATTPSGTAYYVFAVIGHASRRVHILGATAHPNADWAIQLVRNLVMDLQDSGAMVKYLIRDRNTKFTRAFDPVFIGENITIVTTDLCIPRMNSVMERWVQSCRRELLDRTLIWNHPHLRRALREFESFYNAHRPHRALHNAAPLTPLSQSTSPQDIRL